MPNSMNEFKLHKEDIKHEALNWVENNVVLPNAPAWMQAMRETGAESFSCSGIPSSVMEDWKYTSLRELNKIGFKYSLEETVIDVVEIPEKLLPNSKRIVVVDGKYNQLLSDRIDGIEITGLDNSSLADIAQYLVTVGNLEKEPMKALNAAYMNDGIVLNVKRCLKEVVEILFYNTGDNKAIYPRNLYWLDNKSSAVIIERYVGDGVYLFNSYTSIVQNQESVLKLYRINEESKKSFHFSSLNIQQHKDSVFDSFVYMEGSSFSRIEYSSDLVDKNAKNTVGGIYLSDGEQMHDFKVLTNHLEPECKSSQYFRGALNASSQVNIRGKVYVAKNAQKTDAYQINKSILLSKNAKINVKPELEIYADDVKCGHGASSGQLDDNALFYMQSRGIEEKESRNLLVGAFLNEALNQITFDEIKDLCESRVMKWLEK